jgi:hypothetical protein
VRGWPCEVDVPPPGPSGVSSLEALTRLRREEDPRTRRLQEEPAGLLGGPQASERTRRFLDDRCRFGCFSCRSGPEARYLRSFWPGFTSEAFAIRTPKERDFSSTTAPSARRRPRGAVRAAPSARPHWRKDGLDAESSIRVPAEEERPHPTIARGAGPLHRPRIPERPRRRREGRWCLTESSLGALGAESFSVDDLHPNG